jgi:hypothetical protein
MFCFLIISYSVYHKLGLLVDLFYVQKSNKRYVPGDENGNCEGGRGTYHKGMQEVVFQRDQLAVHTMETDHILVVCIAKTAAT